MRERRLVHESERAAQRQKWTQEARLDRQFVENQRPVDRAVELASVGLQYGLWLSWAGRCCIKPT